MPIVVNVDVMLARRKMSSQQLAAQIGITSANLSILKTNKARAIRFSTLEELCRALDCQPGDLLEYLPEPGQASPPEEGTQAEDGPQDDPQKKQKEGASAK